jgi:hypothetical protein
MAMVGDGKVLDVLGCAFQCFPMLSNAFPMKSMLQKTSKTLGGDNKKAAVKYTSTRKKDTAAARNDESFKK